MQSLEKHIASFREGHPMDLKAPDAQGMMAATFETFTALYCLAVAVLARNADGIWSPDKPLFHWYTARTFDLLQTALKEGGVVGFKELVDECTELYLHGRPTLAEFAEQMPDYIFNAAELQPALAKNNWNLTFYLKAKTCILRRLGVSTVGSCQPSLKKLVLRTLKDPGPAQTQATSRPQNPPNTVLYRDLNPHFRFEPRLSGPS
jgi:hypothetical protein